MNDLGSLFRVLRKERGFTLKSLSEGIVSFSYLSKFEKGKTQISLNNFIQLLQRMNLTVDEILYFNQIKTNHYREFFQKISIAHVQQDLVKLKNYLEIEKTLYQEDKIKFHKYNATMIGAVIKDLDSDFFISEDDIHALVDYILACSFWTTYEISLFGNSLSLFSEDLLIVLLKEIRVFPIYQDGGYYNEYFDDDQGKIDAKIAYDKANELGFPDGTTIYFAVDYDAYDYQVTDRILPYMREIRAYFNQLKDDPNMPTYKIGIYGPRNICIRCANDSSIRTDNSFVSNMSTGFSGNLGFPMPKNWAFSQFYETSIGEGSGYLEIDKNDYSGRDSGASSFAPNKVASRSELEKAAFAEWEALAEKTPFLSNRYFVISPQFEFKQKYRLIETSIYRVEVEASVGYEPPAKLEGLTFNVMNGQLEASVETVLGIGASVLSSAGLSLVKNQLQSIAAGVDNGQIVVSLEVENNEILCHLDLVKEEIETDKGKVNILARITVALKLNPFSEAQIDQLLELTTSYQYVVALIIVVGLVTIASPGIPGIIAFISSMFIGFA